MQWNTSQFGANTYQLDYDGANRLTEAVFSGTGQHNTIYSYDKNGNIETLTRQGRYGGSQFYGSIDTLTYTYQGNQLKSVNDLNDGYGPHQGSGFSDHGSFLTTEYFYDDNGNLTSDLNKSLSVNQYNHLNLPEQIDLDPTSQTQEVNYLYDATGNKLRKETRINYTTETTTDYTGSFIYENGALQSILTTEGRVVVDGGSYEYQYFLKDHLGNTRVTFTENGSIIQEGSYYPFGMAMAGLKYETETDLPNKYLYNGKEMQDDFGLEWYDFHARFYDPSLARTTTQDPHAENYYSESNYSFMGNNPIKNIDPTGMDWYTSTDGSATIWKEGSAEIEGYNNIGAEYTLDVGNGTNIIYNQNEAISMTETVLEEGDWETQREPKYNENGEYVGSKNKAGDEGNCFYQAGKMVENSGATSLLGTANDVNGTADQTGYMNAEVSNGNSVRVHVDYNADGNGDHWVAISSRTTDLQNNTSTYNFYDPGTVSSANGTHSSNTFSVESNSISGTTRYSGRTYTITAVRKNTP